MLASLEILCCSIQGQRFSTRVQKIGCAQKFSESICAICGNDSHSKCSDEGYYYEMSAHDQCHHCRGITRQT